MNKRLEAEEIKQNCAKLIGYDKCFVCGCKKARGGMTVHHLEYVFDDVTYKKYPRNDTGKLQYYIDLYKMVELNPKRFMFLCNKHHQALERLNRYSDKILNKLLKALKKTKTK